MNFAFKIQLPAAANRQLLTGSSLAGRGTGYTGTLLGRIRVEFERLSIKHAMAT